MKTTQRRTPTWSSAGSLSVLLLGLFGMMSFTMSQAADNNPRLYRPVDNWYVDDQHGVVYVTGSLTDSPCRLAVTSQTQSLVLGNLDMTELQLQGKGKPVPLHLVLEDCLETATRMTDTRTGQVTWSASQPGVTVRFMAPSVPGQPDLAKVTGVHGVGLQLSNAGGQRIALGQATRPQLVPSGQTTLTYYVTPVRTGRLQPGRYSALLAFEMLYD